jgi:hypothetical protein
VSHKHKPHIKYGITYRKLISFKVKTVPIGLGREEAYKTFYLLPLRLTTKQPYPSTACPHFSEYFFSTLDERDAFNRYLSMLQVDGTLIPLKAPQAMPYGLWNRCAICGGVWLLNEDFEQVSGHWFQPLIKKA